MNKNILYKIGDRVRIVNSDHNQAIGQEGIYAGAYLDGHEVHVEGDACIHKYWARTIEPVKLERFDSGASQAPGAMEIAPS